MRIFRRRTETDRAIADRRALTVGSAGVGVDYFPPAFIGWAQEYGWLLDEIFRRWLQTGESPRRADIQQALLADGRAVYVAEVLHGMPRPLGWVEPQDQRVALSLFGLRLTPTAQGLLVGLGPLVALAVARYREGGPRAVISAGDVERGFAIDGVGASALTDRLFAELPFLGQQAPAPAAEDGEAHMIREDIARYTEVQTTDDYLRIRADEISTHPQFGWGRWEPERLGQAVPVLEPARAPASPIASLTRRLLNHPWVVGTGTVVVGGVILAVILGHS